MRAVVLQRDRSLAVGELPDPEPGPGQARVRVAACGICGSDLHGRHSSIFPVGGIFGHEFAGTVDVVGDGVHGWDGGERVCVFPMTPSDDYDLELMMSSGIGLGMRPGAYAEAVVCDAEMLWRLPEGVELEHGALTEPLAVALHALNVAVFEAAGHPSALPLAIELVAAGGIVSLLGVHEDPVEVSQLTLMLKEAQIRACMAYRPGDFDEAIELIASGRVPVGRLVTAREPLERANELFDELTSGSTAHLKVLLQP